MASGFPTWAQRIRTLREARRWSQSEAAEQMRRHTKKELPGSDHLLRRWKAWELGENKPSSFYAPVIAATLGTVTAALFPPPLEPVESVDLFAATGMDTLELINRLNASAISDATLDGLRIMVDKLCSEYSSADPNRLLIEARQWLGRIVELQGKSLSFGQRRETLELAGWFALLAGCLEYDMGDRRAAEATRQAALSIGQEVQSKGILGWAHEMRAWFALTSGDYRGVNAAAQGGLIAAGDHGVAVQLIAQEAKAWARMGRRAEMEAALERGRVMIEGMSYPENIENHFVVDPAKYDFYAMDCYRQVGEDRLAQALAEDVICVGTDFNGKERAPMRIAEAQITLGVVAARTGDLDEALSHGRRALGIDRRSLPHLAMLAQDLAAVLTAEYPNADAAAEYLDELRSIRHAQPEL